MIGCDILRVIGCSLRNEDISLLSLIFASQLNKQVPFSIEFIDFDKFILGDENDKGVIPRLSFLSKPSQFSALKYYDKDIDTGLNPFYNWVRMLINIISKKDQSINSDIILSDNLNL